MTTVSGWSELYIYTIMRGCSDRAGPYTVKRQSVGKLGVRIEEMWDFDSLEEARESVPFGLICLPRDERDDLIIVESWI
jgi:hypothetical protein